MSSTVNGALAGLLFYAFINVDTALSQQAQRLTAPDRARTQVLLASFNKTKHAVKERHGVRVEKYKRVRSEAAIRLNPENYSGTYEMSDLGFALRLRVDRNGNVEATGEEPLGGAVGVRRTFVLRNARVDGALLTGTRVYADGTSDYFEGVFINLTSFDSPADKGVSTFGLGVTGRAVAVSGVVLDKFFYELKQPAR